MKATPIELDGAVVAITGGARGIGRATARAFVACGASVALGDLDGAAVGEAAEALGGRAHAFALDVRHESSFAEFVAATERDCGPIDVLVNNAGIMPAGRFLDETAATAAAIVDVNVHGPIFGMKLVLPGMIERRRGHVVNVASYAGKFEIPGLATYCASKFAVVGLTGTVARELRQTGVTLTCVMPSAVETELSSGIPFPFSRVAKVAPEQVAEAILGSLADRPGELTVPAWLSGYEQFKALVPSGVEGIVRRALGDDRAITSVDHAERAAYEERLARQTGASR
jgi:NADP-dependent 3-hydroxy acid dehydrogenase YdfG